MPTLSSLKAAGARVWWKCQQCEASGDVDVDRVIVAKGPGYDLTDRTAACPAQGCTYWVGFYAAAGLRNTPLRTEAGVMREMDRRSAWLLARRHRLHNPRKACRLPGMTDDYRAQIDGQRLVLFRLLTLLSTDRLQEMTDSARRSLEHVDSGGETIPPSGASERAALAAGVALLEEALANRMEHENPA